MCLLLLLATIQLVAQGQSSAKISDQSAQQFVKPDSIPQKDLGDVFSKAFHIKPKKLPPTGRKKIYFSLLPTSSIVPRGSDAVLSTLNDAFYLGSRRNTSLSTVTFTPYPDLDGRYVFPIRSNIWLSKNSFNIQGDVRFLIYPQYTWGLGGKQPEDRKISVYYNYIRYYQTILKKIRPNFFGGIGYNLDDHFHMETLGDSLQKFVKYNYGTGHSSLAIGLTANLLYDSRNSSINPTQGFYANAIYRNNQHFLGSDDNWQSVFVDARKYFSFSHIHHNVLALWSYYWAVVGGNAPYYDLPSIGWDPYTNSGRGYQQSRYRGQKLFYIESEYRRDLTANGLFGYVLFANLHSVSEPATNTFTYWHPAGGLGLRIKLSRNSNTNIDVDYGIGTARSGFYLNVAEMF